MTRTPPGSHASPSTFALSLGALGVVYGDIGTSPLYALRECFHGPHAVAVTEANILGIESLILWSLVLVVSLKYLALVMRADNDGEGGILALLALVSGKGDGEARIGPWLMVTGLFGAALLYGDGVITPAISVLSAIEGLEVATPVFAPYVVPITLAILVGLFAFQSRGTEKVGRVFGPLMVVWFTVLAVLGLIHMTQHPGVLAAVHPGHAIAFFRNNGLHGFLILGVVFLVVTGGEALYADMGHFGRRPIRIAWFAVALPALMINYFGQGALLLKNPELAHNPFFHQVDGWLKYPLVVLATLATIVASQAVISGAFSLTMQAVQLGYLPRVEIRHTSRSEYGQVYIPLVNQLLLAATILLVLAFPSSSKLAAAYGMAVTTTMVITTALAFVAMRRVWNWPLPVAAGIAASLLVLDLGFFGANLAKVHDGGWLPLLIGIALVVVMTTWQRGRELLELHLAELTMPYDQLFERLVERPPIRTPGVEVHLSSQYGRSPPTLLRNLKHNGVLREQVAVVTIVFSRAPFVPAERRIEVERPREDFFLVRLRYGFLQRPNVPHDLQCEALADLRFDPGQTSYLLGRETVLATRAPGMWIWREQLFAFLARNAQQAAKYYRIPASQVLELGAEIRM